MAGISLLPGGCSKLVHFVRHGEVRVSRALSCSLPERVQGTHNVAGAIDYANYKSERFFDAHLTALGWQQGLTLRAHAQEHLSASLELVVVSPLSRAVETAVAAFGGASPAPHGEPLLMVSQEAVCDTRVARPSVSACGAPPFGAFFTLRQHSSAALTAGGCALSSVVCELCREHLGVHPCDRRRPLAAYRAAFPALDWSQCETEEVRTGGWRQRFALSLTRRRRTSCGRRSGARQTRSWRSAPPTFCAGALCALNCSAALTPGAALRRQADGAAGAAHRRRDALLLAGRNVPQLHGRVLAGGGRAAARLVQECRGVF